MKRLTYIAFVAFTLVAASAAAATRAGFSGNPCSLVTAGQLSSVHVAVQKCTRRHTSNPMGSAVTGAWGVLSARTPSLAVVVIHANNAAMLDFAKRQNLGAKYAIGEWAEGRLGNGGTGASLAFIKHGYWVSITAHTVPSKPLSSMAPILALAKHVASQF
jgi:hypothetical protein